MTEIIVTSSTRCRENIVFKIEDRGPVSSIKMSLDCNILTMMRTTLSVVSLKFYSCNINTNLQKYHSKNQINLNLLCFISINKINLLDRLF
jgi:hypothetical protein